MIVGFSKYGRGADGNLAVAYLTDGMDTAIPYLTAKTKRGLERNPPPVILRGNPNVTRAVVNVVPFKRKYVSGVLSFSEKSISPEAENDLMNRFEAVAFAGLKEDRRNVLFVRHRHAGREEIHFLIPAIDLKTGKSLNPNPPGSATRELWDTFRRLVNDEYGWSDPDNPARARAIRIPSYVLKGKGTRDNIRSTVSSYLEAKLAAGKIKSRDDALRLVRQSGYAITRTGDHYVTIADSAGQRCRLKGRLFDKDFSCVPTGAKPERLSGEERARLEAKLAKFVEARRAYNEKRFGVEPPEMETPKELNLPNLKPPQKDSHDRIRTPAHVRAGALAGRMDGARGRIGQVIERCRSAARGFREGHSEFGRAAHLAFRTSESFERRTRGLGGVLEEKRSQLKERSLTQSILSRYGPLPSAAAQSRGRELDWELEPDFV